MSITPIPPEEKDFILLDRYTQFSTELVKLSMAAIGAVWIIVIAVRKTPDNTLAFSLSDSFYLKSFLSCLFLIMAVLCGLAHRYVATDSMASWLNASRKTVDIDSSHRVKRELDERDKKFRRAGFLIAMEGLFLTTGLIIIALLFL